MALSKRLKTATGIDAEYWTIGVRHIDDYGRICYCTLHGYPSESVRRDAATTQPLETKEVHLPIDAVGEGTKPEFYAAIKEHGLPELVVVKAATKTKPEETARLALFRDAKDLKKNHA